MFTWLLILHLMFYVNHFYWSHLIPIVYISLLSHFTYDETEASGVEKLSRLMQTVSSGTGIWTQAVQLESSHFVGSPSHSFFLWLELWAWQIPGKVTFFISQDLGRSTQMWPQNDRCLGYFRDDSKALLLLFCRQDYYWLLLQFRWNNLPSIPNWKFLCYNL